MNIPAFTAQAALYQTRNRYHSSSSEYGGSPSSQSVVPAYYPGPESVAKCQSCLDQCNVAAAACYGGASIALAPFLIPGCVAAHASCGGYCLIPGAPSDCCPKFCQAEPFNQPSGGCCDQDEHCVAEDDPNSRHGCCPSDQSVCGGKCCAKAEVCCGETCCPPNYYCLDGGFCSQFPSGIPFGNPLRPSAPGTPRDPRIFSGNSRYCGIGQTPCGNKCCPRGLECCDTDAGPVCMTSCGPR